jgi:glutathione S-transferase
MLRLFYSPGACSLVSHVALEEAGASFEAVRVAIAEGSHRRPDYLAVNPRGLIPALEIDGRVYAETIALLTLIDRLHPSAGLLPAHDPLALARTYQLLSYFATTVHIIGFKPVFRVRRGDLGPPPDAATQAADREVLRGYLGEVEALLAHGEWLLGDRYSAADAYPLTFLRWARRQDFDMSGFTHWRAHAGRMLRRPAVLRALATEGLEPSEF